MIDFVERGRDPMLMVKRETDVLRRAQAAFGGEIKDGKLYPLEPYFRSLMSVPVPLCQAEGVWHVVATEPKHESLAMHEIAGRGLVTYLPIVPRSEAHGRGGVRCVERPMFPSYLFVRCRHNADDFAKITCARGVRRLIAVEGKPSRIADAQIEVIRLVEAEKAEDEARRLVRTTKSKSCLVWDFAPGERVRIKEGPLAGFYAQLTAAVDEWDRIKALVTMFGGPSSVELSAFDIEKP
jgi:transcriptional antiterminator NusG